MMWTRLNRGQERERDLRSPNVTSAQRLLKFPRHHTAAAARFAATQPPGLNIASAAACS